MPRFAVVHRTYRHAGEVKPLQVLGGVETNLCLRARYGGVGRTLQGISMVLAEIARAAGISAPPARIAAGAVCASCGSWPQFASTRVRPTETFHPVFNGWSYELRRDGAFVAMHSRREEPRRDGPLVSILIRTIGRTASLRQALESRRQPDLAATSRRS